MSSAVTLRMLDNKDVMKLPRNVKGAIYDFQAKFRQNPQTPGLNLEKLQDSQLFSARVTREYRALLMRVGDADWVGLTVMHHSKVYKEVQRLEQRFALSVNTVTGGMEFLDVVSAEESVHARQDTSQRQQGPDRAAPEGDEQQPPTLFAGHTDEELRSLGVAEPLLPLVRRLNDEAELLGLVEYVPRLTAEVLLALHDGQPVQRVREEITEPQAADEPVDPDDYQRALARPATPVAVADDALQPMLEGTFDKWRVFLHPDQRKLVERDYSGPARVSGGPGTGKTVVALHRAVHLARQLPPGDDKPILVTTFTRNLARDLHAKLLELADAELVARIDVDNINRVASRIVREAESGTQRRILGDADAVQQWRDMLRELGETGWDAEFLAAEWSQVILGQVLTSWPEYARARRAGRGKALNRADRKRVWQLAERFGKRLDEQGWTTHTAVTSRAAELCAGGDSPGGAYRHIVADEAQDLHPAHWKLLRSLVAPGRNDLFCVADTHQRIYDNVVSLGSLGINIRGRSAKLRLNYRTTRQILAAAMGLLRGETYDDLDGGADTLTGYRSILTGQRPIMRGFADRDGELDAIAAQIGQWGADGADWDALAVAVPTRELASAVVKQLTAAEIPAVEMTGSGSDSADGVRVGTMHRFKGLEFQRLIAAGVSDGLIPRHHPVADNGGDEAADARRRQRDRSLLFVAVTRARDELAVFWHGAPSPFLPEELVRGADQ